MNAANKDDIPINTYISIEDLTSEGPKRSQKSRDVEIRYLESIRRIRNKIKSSYLCSQEQCSVIKKRLTQHQLECHSQTANKPTEPRDNENRTKLKSHDAADTGSRETIHRLTIAEPCVQRSVAVSPKVSILKRTIDTQCQENNSMKTLAKYKNFNHTVQDNIDDDALKSDDETTKIHSSSQNTDELKPCHNENKISFTTKNNLMKDDLEDTVIKWIKNIPIYSNVTPLGKIEKRNLINEFIEKIFILTNEETTEDNYKDKVKIEIDNFLNSLPIWYPDGKRNNNDSLKKGLCKKLLDKLRALRSKVYVDDAVNTDISLKLFPLDNLENDKIVKLIESEIIDWLMQIKFKESEEIGRTINIIDTTYVFTRRLMPLLNTPVNKNNYKFLVKGLILDTLNDLPNVLQYPENKVEYIKHIAEELTNRLTYILVKCCDSDSCCRFLTNKTMYPMAIHSNSNLRRSNLDGQNNRLDNFQLRFNLIEEVTNILVECIETVFSEDVIKNHEENDVFCLSTETPDNQTSDAISGTFIENVKDELTEDVMREAKYSDAVNRPCFSNTVAVFTSEHDLSGSSYPITSTPKNKSDKRDNKQHSLEEIEYTKKVSNLIRAWMEMLPKSFNEDKYFKETIIADLAGDILDEIKLEQLVPNPLDRDQIMSYIIFRWLYRFEVFADLSEDTPPQVAELIKHLNDIAVPNLTKPRYGNRQDLAKLKVKESDRDFFVPKGIDVLEDEISIWMNEQPTEIYSKNDDSNRHKNIHELAATLQKHLFEKKSEKEITDQISKWLKKILKSSEKKNRERLAESLKERIVTVPQDYTLREKLHKKIQAKLRDEAAKLNLNQSNLTNIKTPTDNPDNTLKEFVIKFMEHNYDVADTIAREAFGDLLRREFCKLSLPTRKEEYDIFRNRKTNEDFSTERLNKELEYIKIVSDWLRHSPIRSTFKTPQNAERIEFVNNLAKNIYEVEEERRGSPTAMDYNMYLASIITQFTNELPIFPEHELNVTLMADQLMNKIIASRTLMPCCQNSNRMSSAQRSTGIQEQHISKFIDHYIHQNAADFAHDSIRTDAWSNRVLKEIKRIAQTTTDPSTLCKAQVNGLIDISIPGEDSVKIFAKELDYAREISEWTKNLPLLRNPQADEIRMKLICELAEMLADRDKNRLATNTAKSDAEIKEYINQWIDKIPINSMKSIVKPILVGQLLKRIETTNKGNQKNTISQDTPKNKSSNMTKNNNKIIKPRPKRPKCNSSCSSYGKTENSGQVAVEAIENWSSNLPIQSHSKDEEKNIKQEIATKLYQKVGELSVNPQVTNDNNLFEKLLSEEVNMQLNNIPHNPSINKKKDAIKNELVDKIIDARSIAQENAVAENYKHQLENTIEASIPNPISNRQMYDPGFEIYKSRLVDMFIINNFDHSNDAAKMKYERNIKNEVDKYFRNVQKRNAVPVTKNEIFNELYSALFKVPIPKEGSLIDKVEEVKTRCEIDMWFKNLNIQEPSNFIELLERDKLLTMLAKRLHEMETIEKQPEEKMHKEITKWVMKFPLLPGEQHNASKFANDLLTILKTSKEERKCDTNSTRKENKNNAGQTKSPKPSNSRFCWVRPAATEPQSCCQITPTPTKKPADMILEIVEAWCEQLPLPTITPSDHENNKIIRDNLLTNVIMKICELNSNPLTFNDEILYDYYLDAELEALLSNLPICCDFENTKYMKKIQLKAAIKSIMPLMKEEKSRHNYKEELKTTIDAVLIEPLNTTTEKIAIFNQLRDDIVDNFIQLYYNEDDDDGKQFYKAKLHEILLKYFQDIKDSADEPPVDPLIRQNQLLCELAKVPVPTASILKDEVEEIRMKDEVQEFFADLGLPEVPEDKLALKKDLKLSLAKQLHEIERKGHNCDNDNKMKKCITRCLEKLNLKVSSNKVDDFIHKLKTSEAFRKALPMNTTITDKVDCIPVRLESDIQFCSMKTRGIKADSNIGTIPVGYQGFGGDIPASSSIIQEKNAQEFNTQGTSFPNIAGKRYATDQFASDLRYKAAQDAPTVEQSVILPKDPVYVKNRRLTSTNSTDAEELCKCGRRLRRLRGRPGCVLRMEDYEYDHFIPPPMWIPYRGPPRCFYF